MRRLLAGLVLVAGAGAMPRPVLAACNLIPGTIRSYDGVLGATNRPFAAPGERVEIGVRDCDTASPGISASAANHLVTVVFTPPSGARHAIVLTAAADCNAVTPKIAACGAAFPSIECVASAGTTSVEHDGRQSLSFPFPNTDADLGAPSGLRASATIPGGGLCAGKPCWKATSSGFKYAEKLLTPSGVKSVTLRAGLVPGQATIKIAGKGALVDVPALDALAAPLTMQLTAATGACWEAEYDAPFALQTAAQLKAKSN